MVLSRNISVQLCLHLSRCFRKLGLRIVIKLFITSKFIIIMPVHNGSFERSLHLEHENRASHSTLCSGYPDVPERWLLPLFFPELHYLDTLISEKHGLTGISLDGLPLLLDASDI